MIYGILAVAIILLLAALVLIRTTLFSRPGSDAILPFEPLAHEIELDPMIPAGHLSELVKIETVTHEDPAQNVVKNFTTLHKQLQIMYPLAHSVLTWEIVDGYSLVYTWKGKDPSLDPVAFMAHQDVVPADETTLDQWTWPPFSGRIVDGFIWGRGTLDIKCQLVAIFEAIENLVRNNFQPERTILLTFGHDEEVLGNGSKAIVSHLQQQGIHLYAVLDEGGCVYDGVVPGVNGLAAVIGVAEKGYLSLKFKVTAKGGHSSTPTPETAIGILCRAIDRLQTHPFPYKVKAILPLFKGLTPALSPTMQMAFANLWLFGGIVRRQLLSDPETAATIHTTTAPTIIGGGVKNNILPSLAEAVVNFRILPGESIAQVCDRVRKIIGDERVTFEPMEGYSREPSPISPTDSHAYRHIVSVNEELFPESVSAPYVMLGGTDAYNYQAVSSQVYRYSPCVMQKEDLERVHGINERLSVDALSIMVRFFYSLVQRWSTPEM